MNSRTIATSLMGFLLVAGITSADLKLVKKTHRDGYQMMGQNQPASDQEEITWMGKDRMRMDQGDTSSIVRLDTSKLLLLNHTDKTFNVIDLPIDLSKMLPEQMAAQMKAMMTFEITVTPADESKKVGQWNARRYDMKMTSQMMTVESTLWATKDIKMDLAAFYKMFQQIAGLQPGMENLADEMKKIDGVVVAQESTMTMAMMGNSKVASTEETISAEELDAPAGTYDPPQGYTEESFDYMKRMQQGR